MAKLFNVEGQWCYPSSWTFCQELVLHKFPLLVLNTLSIYSFHLWCIHCGTWCLRLKFDIGYFSFKFKHYEQVPIMKVSELWFMLVQIPRFWCFQRTSWQSGQELCWHPSHVSKSSTWLATLSLRYKIFWDFWLVCVDKVLPFSLKLISSGKIYPKYLIYHILVY